MKNQGFKNKETLFFSLWINNERQWYEETVRFIEKYGVDIAAKEVKRQLHLGVCDQPLGLFTDFLTHSIDSIDFETVLGNMVED